MAIKKFRSHGNSLFSSPHPLDFNMSVIFSLRNVKQGHKLELTYLHACWIMHMKCCYQYQNGMAKVAKKAVNIGRSGTQFVAMVTELLGSYRRAHLVKLYCKVSNISDANWLRYLFSSYLNKIWLSVWLICIF